MYFFAFIIFFKNFSFEIFDLILDNLFNSRGVFPPEIVGANINCMEFILEYLRQRNVIISEKTH